MSFVVKAIAKALARQRVKIPLVGSVTGLARGLLFGYLALPLWQNEIRYSRDGRQATARVEKYSPGKSGLGNVHLTYEADGRAVEAHMTTWLYSVKPGDEAPILYRPG